MEPLLKPLRAPACSSCIRRMTASFLETTSRGSCQQVRGKKMLARDRDHTIKVRLLRNVIGYGRKGTVVPVLPGKMRNYFLPSGNAEYVSREELKQLKAGGATFERAFAFGKQIVKIEEEPSVAPVVEVEDTKPTTRSARQRSQPAVTAKVELMQPARAQNIIEMIIPMEIEFFRTPISISAPPPLPKVSPSIPASSQISHEAAAAQAAQNKGKTGDKVTQVDEYGETPIYGSVTTADIAANMKAVLAEDEEGSKVALKAEDITFVNEFDAKNIERDRVKTLGLFEIDIAIKGSPSLVRRFVKVSAQE